MKKLIAVIMLFTLLFGGCNAKQADDNSEHSHLSDQPAAQDSQPDFVALERGEVLMEQQEFPYEDYWKMLLLDYGKAAKAAVCSKEGCSHDNPDCPAWHKDYGRSNCNYYRADENIIGIQVMPQLDDNGLSPIDRAKIIACNLDGADVRTIYECADEEYLGQGKPIYDGQYLYVEKLRKRAATGVPPDDSPDEFDKTLLKIDVSNGELAGEFDLKNDELIAPYFSPQQLVGKFDGKPLYLYERREPCETKEQMLRYGTDYPVEIVLFTLSLRDGETREVYKLGNPGERFYDYNVWQTMNDGSFPAIRLEDLALLSVDIKTGKVTVVTAKPEEWESYSVEIVDDHFVFGVETKDGEKKRFAMPVEGGDITELTWSYYYNGGKRFSSVWAVADSGYLVDYDSRTNNKILLDPSGEPIPIEQESILFGMISKDDYWNDIPNFEEIMEIE